MMNPAGEKVSTGHDHADTQRVASSHPLSKGTTQSHALSMEHQNLKVSGNCEMCKDRIETAAKSVSGVSSADWMFSLTEQKPIRMPFRK